MKRILLAAAVATVVISCKKVSEGGNQGVLRIEKDADRYDAEETRGAGESGHATTTAHSKVVKEVVTVEVKGAKLSANKNGLEEQIVHFLNTGGYDKAADDAALKNQWFSFDNVNFEMASTNKMLPGSAEQLQNLAAILKAFPMAKIKIGGYTDNTGDKVVNQKISQGRAEFIRQELTKMGVGAQVVGAEGYGSQFATVPATASDEARAVDRKMAVRFTK